MARVLITGGSGLIGRHAVRELHTLGHELHIAGRRQDLETYGRFHKLDLLDQGDVDRLIREVRPESLLHLAWETEHGKYWHSPANLDFAAATLSMARSFAEAGGTRFVGAGTCAEYSWAPQNTETPLDELKSIRDPHTLYGTSKNDTFQILEKFFSDSGLRFSWGRLFLLYGPGEDQRRLCPDVIRNLLQGKMVKCSSGRQIRDFMHTEDAGRAFAALLTGDVNGAVNIASGVPLPLGDFVNQIASMIGHPELVRLGALPDRPDDPGKLVPDISRLRDEVGYENKYSLLSGIGDTIDWWRRTLAES